MLLLFAGNIKGAPLISRLPFDLTVLAACGVAMLVVRAIWDRQGRPLLPSGSTPALLLAVLLLPGVVVAPVSPYASEKRSLLLISLIVGVGALYLIDSRPKVIWLFRWIAVGALVVAAMTWLSPSVDYGRVSIEGGGTIGVARATGAGVVALIALSLLSQRILVQIGQVLLAVVLVGALVATGQRGPLVAVGFAVVLLAAVRPSRHRLRNAVVVGCIASLAAWWAWSQAEGLARVRLSMLVDEDPGASVRAREIMWEKAARAAGDHALGLGWGNLGMEIAPYQYPHNVALEIAAENGWLSGLAFVFVLSVAILRARRFVSDAAGLGVFLLLVFYAINSMVSGDVNDNRPLLALLVASLVLPAALGAEEAGPARPRGSRGGEGGLESGRREHRPPHDALSGGAPRAGS